ncbi:hypothetical protein M8494_22995 [Serratia ureilytica]
MSRRHSDLAIRRRTRWPRNGGAARPAAPGHALEPARVLAILAGGLSVAVPGALMWSLQPQRRGAGESTGAVQRRSRFALPKDWSGCRPTIPNCRRLAARDAGTGPPLPGDLGPAIVNAQQQPTVGYARHHDHGRGRAPGPVGRRPRKRPHRRCSSARARESAVPVAQSQVAAAPGFLPMRLRSDGGRAGLDGGPARRSDHRTEPAGTEGGVLQGASTKPAIPAT